MESSMIYILIAVSALVLVIIGLFLLKKSKEKPSSLINVAIILIVFSMFFDERIIAYPLLGIAVILSIIDTVIKLKKKNANKK